jgi:hypothetical protein
MDRSSKLIVVTTVFAVALGGCRGPVEVPLAVGTCVRSDDRGTIAVACSEPHTHKVIAVVADAQACPIEADMISQPANPENGLTTICFLSDPAGQ